MSEKKLEEKQIKAPTQFPKVLKVKTDIKGGAALAAAKLLVAVP